MTAAMTKKEFLRTLRAQRAQWEALVAYIDARDMLKPGPDGGWSVKDIIAHITWYERETVGMLRARALEGSDWWYLPLDERNQRIHEEVSRLPLDAVLDEADMVFADLLNEVEQLSEADLHDVTRFEGWPSDWVPWKAIASNSYEHYQQHLPDLLRWVKLEE
ncbi:hypothetical protein ADN00_06770 [Ornatilinea apprima]|uniref:DinB-like domain-containing protein n=1 Tax=Ornatilinea apprima TaxID=1134406 RepID=A0A0P6XDY2_9CHLR|nr:maleylpyruvate isomerase N-terminal domain-containing protein [Ornatilinea apprima]KPL78422.1 hypothetical protein ADN00_06770 [Ornatilinea apprima]